MSASPDEVAAGHAFYTRTTLRLYDPMILGFFSRVAWQCPKARIVRHYDAHVTGNHLDVGVGTGYFLDKCRLPTATPRLVLMDLNLTCLEVAARRLARYEPERRAANVLEPIVSDGEPFDSIGLNYLLHCVPGSIRDKAVVVEHLAQLARPGAVLFGATLLHDGVERNWYARQVMARNNRVGIFSNSSDDLDGLRWALDRHLAATEVTTVGCVAIFSGRVPE
jgi:SAM-dependent methyltransferase